VSAEPLRPVYLIKGTDRPKLRRALARLRARFDEGSIETLSAEKTIDREALSGPDAVDACNALGLFGGEDGRLVVVERIERWKAEDVAAIVGYLANPAPATVLALVAGEELRGSTLAEACAKAGQVLSFDVPKARDPSAWARAEFERLGAGIDPDAVRRLVEVVGDDPTTVASEIEKIATWAGGERIGVEAVEALAVPAHDSVPWELTDAWGEGDAVALLRATERALEEGKEPFVIALGLVSHLRLVGDAEALAEEGLATPDIARRLKKKTDFPIRKALAHAEARSKEERERAVVRLAALDAALKGASKLSAELELERALLDITRPRESVSRRP
jgi:DNA polymerase-3 subunit delta